MMTTKVVYQSNLVPTQDWRRLGSQRYTDPMLVTMGHHGNIVLSVRLQKSSGAVFDHKPFSIEDGVCR